MSIRDEQFPDATTRQTPQCPRCGGCYNPNIDYGWANDRELKLKDYQCSVCGHIYTTVELVLPEGSPRATKFFEDRTKAHREGARRRRGYQGTPARGEPGRRRWATIKGYAISIHDPDAPATIHVQQGKLPTTRIKSRKAINHDGND